MVIMGGAAPPTPRDLALFFARMDVFLLSGSATCRTMEALDRRIGQRRDATRAPNQARNGWRPHGRLLSQPAAPSKDRQNFVQTMGSTSHQVVDHAVQYVDGKIHTNGLENFWSLLKRGLSGTYISVEPFHLFRYLDEQSFRYNNREEMNDYDRFRLALSQITGKRLTYEHLTGKDREPDTAVT